MILLPLHDNFAWTRLTMQCRASNKRCMLSSDEDDKASVTALEEALCTWRQNNTNESSDAPAWYQQLRSLVQAGIPMVNPAWFLVLCPRAELNPLACADASMNRCRQSGVTCGVYS